MDSEEHVFPPVKVLEPYRFETIRVHPGSTRNKDHRLAGGGGGVSSRNKDHLTRGGGGGGYLSFFHCDWTRQLNL